MIPSPATAGKGAASDGRTTLRSEDGKTYRSSDGEVRRIVDSVPSWRPVAKPAADPKPPAATLSASELRKQKMDRPLLKLIEMILSDRKRVEGTRTRIELTTFLTSRLAACCC